MGAPQARTLVSAGESDAFGGPLPPPIGGEPARPIFDTHTGPLPGQAPIIPPGLGFIIYGFLADVSIGRLFIGGIVPGIMAHSAMFEHDAHLAVLGC